MRTVLYIALSIAALVIAATVSVYLLVLVPRQSLRDAEISRTRAESEINLEKQRLINDCLKLKYTDAGNETKLQQYARSNMDCEAVLQ